MVMSWDGRCLWMGKEVSASFLCNGVLTVALYKFRSPCILLWKSRCGRDKNLRVPPKRKDRSSISQNKSDIAGEIEPTLRINAKCWTPMLAHGSSDNPSTRSTLILSCFTAPVDLQLDSGVTFITKSTMILSPAQFIFSHRLKTNPGTPALHEDA